VKPPPVELTSESVKDFVIGDDFLCYVTIDGQVVCRGDNAYGQLGNVEVRSGDEVSALARLGSVADAADPALMFEVRKGSRTIAPRAWLGL